MNVSFRLKALELPIGAKAAALLHSLARNHALIAWNKRLGLAAVIAFYGLNGRRLTLTNDQAYDLVMKVAAGELDQVEEIAAILAGATAPPPRASGLVPRRRRHVLPECREVAAVNSSVRRSRTDWQAPAAGPVAVDYLSHVQISQHQDLQKALGGCLLIGSPSRHRSGDRGAGRHRGGATRGRQDRRMV